MKEINKPRFYNWVVVDFGIYFGAYTDFDVYGGPWRRYKINIHVLPFSFRRPWVQFYDRERDYLFSFPKWRKSKWKPYSEGEHKAELKRMKQYEKVS